MMCTHRGRLCSFLAGKKVFLIRRSCEQKTNKRGRCVCVPLRTKKSGVASSSSSVRCKWFLCNVGGVVCGMTVTCGEKTCQLFVCECVSVHIAGSRGLFVVF